jgi:hypothetical protein
MKRVLCASVVLAMGCSTSSKDIAPMYVSPLQYQAYTCEQLGAEGARIQTRVQQLGGRLDEAASNDKALTTVGIVLFFPTLFFLGGTKQQEAEYGRLKGEYEAIQQTAVQKNCAGLVAPTQQAGQPAAPAASQAVGTTTLPVAQPAAAPATQPVAQPVSQPIAPAPSTK